ncbi:ABC transporter ATP-binding protein [Pusillimonas sp. CC-YST705]|uniref:ABC transporter ATP-binding protein n=1 Tax=Mesopusillimonas faecipullorum TaxID=2755040 RepID=A0ABS8C979_9BURK|nr:ABC transporter ATP-binding protein [Mesopusillimonas faecipullorum]MCB5362563.1 ABC transporter ATP-binding protein [Mesopusillimonas faecipullorum]
MSGLALETRGLCKRFGALAVTENVNFRLERGARHALIGPNGAGKTTFVNLVSGRLAPTAGQVLLHGQDITRLPEYQRVKLGLVRTFQINALFTTMSALESVALAVCERKGLALGMLKPLGRYADVLERSYATLVQLGIGDCAERQVAELSYGQQRLIEIAIALSLEPTVLLLDEPAAGVPSSESGIILDALGKLDSDISIMIIEHDMDLVFRFARHITVLDQGRVVAEGTPKDISDNEMVRAIYFGEGSRVAHD